MKYRDNVYGTIPISEPVAINIINSPAMQRLKGIDQGAYRKPFFPGTPTNRFDHSVGVFLLLRIFKAPLLEQIAGLIHDVSHSAFSHGIEYILKQGNAKTQGHQDNIHNDFVKNSEITGILSRYGMNVDDILDDSRFPLKENDLPDICADRIDYTLRDGVSYGELTIREAKEILSSLSTVNGRWIFADFAHARNFAQFYNKLNGDYWAGIESAVMFHTVGEYIAHALQKHYIELEDLYTTDQEVFNKIEPHLKNDECAQLLHDRMNHHINFINSPGHFDTRVIIKSRAIDPLCCHDGAVKRVSEIDPYWTQTVQEESKPKEYFIKFEQ